MSDDDLKDIILTYKINLIVFIQKEGFLLKEALYSLNTQKYDANMKVQGVDNVYYADVFH